MKVVVENDINLTTCRIVLTRMSGLDYVCSVEEKKSGEQQKNLAEKQRWKERIARILYFLRRSISHTVPNRKRRIQKYRKQERVWNRSRSQVTDSTSNRTPTLALEAPGILRRKA